MNRTRKLLLLALIVGVGVSWTATVSSGRLFETYAFFSSKGIDTGNTITAKSLTTPTLAASATTPAALGTITLTWSGLPGGDPANQITFKRYPNLTCTGSFTTVGPVAITPASKADTALVAGDYCYTAQTSITATSWTSGVSNNATATITAASQVLTACGTAEVWIGPALSADDGRHIDVKVQAFRNGVKICEGEIDDTPVSGASLSTSTKYTVTLGLFGTTADRSFVTGDTLTSKVIVHKADPSGGNFDLVFYFDNTPSPSTNHGWSRFSPTIGGSSSPYYYRSGSPLPLSTTAGSSATSLTVTTAGTSDKTFGTWTLTWP